MVAEKYIREFCGNSQILLPSSQRVGGSSYKTTKLLQGLKHTGDRQRTTIASDARKLLPGRDQLRSFRYCMWRSSHGRFFLFHKLFLDGTQYLIRYAVGSGLRSVNLFQDTSRLLRMTSFHEPPRRLWQKEHQTYLENRRESANRDHPPPAMLRFR